MDRTTVARWESGEYAPQPWLRPRIAEAFGVSLAVCRELLDLEGVEARGRAGGVVASSGVEGRVLAGAGQMPTGGQEHDRALHATIASPVIKDTDRWVVPTVPEVRGGIALPAGVEPAKAVPIVDAERGDDSEGDLVLSAPWSLRGTVESAVVLRGGGHPVKRRGFVFLSGLALTAPAHQWLIHEPGPLLSGLSGRRVSVALADRIMAMIPELRAMDDVAGGGTVGRV